MTGPLSSGVCVCVKGGGKGDPPPLQEENTIAGLKYVALGVPVTIRRWA